MKVLRIVLVASALCALGATLVLACKEDPLNAIDPRDIPPGGVLVNPGYVTCGTSDAGCFVPEGRLCCVGPGEPEAGACIDAGTACSPGAGIVLCNEAADCPYGQVCCATLGGTTSGTSSACADTCAAPSAQMCRTNGECPGKHCVIQTCPDGHLYELCGAYTGGSAEGGALQCAPQ